MNDQWKKRHMDAFERPAPGFERSLVNMLKGLREYALAHKKRYDSDIAEDGLLGDEWEQVAKGIRGLLNGELGRLDGGSLDALIVNTADEAGFDHNKW